MTIRSKKIQLQAYLSILPLLVLLLVLRVYPIINIVLKSFTNWDGLYRKDWIGLRNYYNFIIDGPFLLILRNTLVLLISVPIQIFIGLLIALLLFEKVAGWKVFRVIIYIPQIISAVIIGYLFKTAFGLYGPFNIILEKVGLGFLAMEWFGNSATALIVITVCLVWFGIGWHAIVMLGGLSQLPESVFEAAIIEGANYWQRFFRIVVPMLVNVIEFAVVASSVWTLTQLFPFLHSMTRGGPGYNTTTLDYMIYLKSFGASAGSNFGMASAISVILLLIVLVLTVIQINFTEKKGNW